MKTNHKILDGFEIATVVLAVVGFLLIGIVLFSTLTPRTQNRINSAVNVLDIHQQFAKTTYTMGSALDFTLDAADEFYKQFYIAFTQVAVLPAETFEVPTRIAADFYQGLGNFSDQIALEYRQQNSADKQVAFDAGQILGAMIELSASDESPDQTPQPIPYGFTSPDWQEVGSVFIQLIKQ